MPKKQISMKATMPAIDRDKVRAALRRRGAETIFYILDEAIDLLSPENLAKLVAPYMDIKELRPDGPTCKKSILDEVRVFDTASRAGRYYESFNVNSKNFMDKSMGTQSFIADCNRLLDRCVEEAPNGAAPEIREAIEMILDLLRYIDECHDDVIFFADEAGAWQVGVDWVRVLPALFLCLSQTTEEEEYGRLVTNIVNEFDKYSQKKHLTAALGLGTSAQRRALRAMTSVATTP